MPHLRNWYQLDASGNTAHFELWVPAILRKNERYRAFGKGRFARIILSAPARKFEKLVSDLCAAVAAPPIRGGVYRMTVHTVWDKQRHVVPSVPGGDSDASLSAIKDALQGAGVIDDDVRVISDVTHNYYIKGERGLLVILDRVDGWTGDLPPDVASAKVAGAVFAADVAAAVKSRPKVPRAPRKAPAPAAKPAKVTTAKPRKAPNKAKPSSAAKLAKRPPRAKI